MEYKHPNRIKSGGSPAAISDYAALCDELSKLYLLPEADIDWHKVQTLCLRLFEHNGVDLQSACWYTLARMHIAGPAGMNDGLFIISALVRYHWSVMWPVANYVRAGILAALSKQLQKALHALILTNIEDLNALYLSEKCLDEIAGCLGHHKLRQKCRLDALLLQVRSAITCLENTLQGADYGQVLELAQQQTAASAESDNMLVRSACSAEPEPCSVMNTVIYISWRRIILFKEFSLGAVSALFVYMLLSWATNVLSRPMPEEGQLVATLTPLPPPLSPTQLNRLWHDSTITETESMRLIEATRQQLVWLQSLPPDWAQQYGRHLIRQARTLWPDNPDLISLEADWQKQPEKAALH